MSKYETFVKILKNSGHIIVNVDKDSRNVIISFKKRPPITITYEACDYFVKHDNNQKMTDKLLALEFALLVNKLL